MDRMRNSFQKKKKIYIYYEIDVVEKNGSITHFALIPDIYPFKALIGLIFNALKS